MITIRLNGEAISLSDSALENLLNLKGWNRAGVAVAVNREVVPRSQWALRQLADGDAVEVLTAAAGG